MKTSWSHGIAMFMLLLGSALFPGIGFAQYPLPKNFDSNAREAYEKLGKKEVEFADYLETEKKLFQQKTAIEKGAAAIYTPKPSKSSCGNGNFEAPILDALEWAAGYGFDNAAGDPLWSTMQDGILSSRHTIVGTGTDAYTGVSKIHSGSYALQLGNNGVGRQCEVVSKTFTVTPSTTVVRFWYCVVLEDPGAGHSNVERPSFWVRVLNGSGTAMSGLVNLGNSVQPDKIWADSNNPFFKKKTVGSDVINYTDWLCAEIDLSAPALMNQNVTVQFITEDCTQGAHFGYAYIDDFCGSCGNSNPQGGIAYLQDGSDCKSGKLCFSYNLPNNGSTTGNVQIKLDILQNGVVVASLNSPTLSSGNQYCFAFEPCKVAGVDPSLGGFDFMATGNFAIGGTTLPPKTAGSKPDGLVLGKNNDCVCPYTKYCCPGENLIKNGDFESGNAGISSQYSYNGTVAANATLPGQYNIVTGAQALTISSGWVVQDPTTCSNASGKFMVVNGATCGPGKKVVWERTFTVKDWSSYKFCASAKNLKQCNFDVKPKIEIQFSMSGIGNLSQTLNVSPGACDWYNFDKNIDLWGYGTSLTIKILLDETTPGDGNDLALDNLALIEIPKCPTSAAVFQVNTLGLNATDYQISATSTTTPDCDAIFWEVCEYDMSANACVSGTTISNIPAWWFANTNFPTYNGGTPGIFKYGKLYKITRGTWGKCHGWASFTRYVGSSPVTKNVKAFTEEEYKNKRQEVLNSLK